MKKKIIFFGSKTTIYLSLGLHKERPSYRRSFQLSKENIQHIFFTFVGYFALLDPDPDLDSDSGSGSTDPDPIRIRIRNLA
jgi:hypothetical protein